MSVKTKQGLGEEAKSGFIACALALIIIISIPVGAVLLFGWWFFTGPIEDDMTEIQSAIDSSCNLVDYEASTVAYDFMDGVYLDLLKEENITIVCDMYTGTWQCHCDATSE